MSKKYMHLLSPIKIGNVIFKNRLITPPSNPYFAQGGEPYPTEASVMHYAIKARNGAAMFTAGMAPTTVSAQSIPPGDWITKLTGWLSPQQG